MSKKQSTTTLAVAGNLSAIQMLDALRNELKSIKKVSETPFRTSGNLEVHGNTMNIKSETSIKNLIKAMGIVLAQEKLYNEGADALTESLGSTVPAFEVSGGTANDWKSDLNLRVQVLSQAQREEELKALIKEGEQFITKEDQFKIFQAKMAAKLGVTVEEPTAE